MITRFSVKNYKALRDVSLDLTPMHVLIGPNDSGKTSLLEAIAALCRSVDVDLTSAFEGRWSGLDLVWRNNDGAIVDLSAVLVPYADAEDKSIRYSLDLSFGRSGRNVSVLRERVSSENSEALSKDGPRNPTWVHSAAREPTDKASPEKYQPWRHVHSLLSGVSIYRWIPRFLSLPNAPDANRRFRMDSTGFGLTLCLDDIIGYDRRLFEKLEQRFCTIFPNVEIIRLLPEPAFSAPTSAETEVPELQRRDGKGLYFQLKDKGALVPASQASDGMLLILAYLAILHLPEPPRVLLIEEPENGIHPARLSEVLLILRELIAEQDHTQVILTTHSPYVVDHFEPKEVTVCYKDDDGAVCTRRLDDSKLVAEQIDFFTLGEIWTAEGDKSLLEPIESQEMKE